MPGVSRLHRRRPPRGRQGHRPRPLRRDTEHPPVRPEPPGSEIVRYVGEAVAVVVADDPYRLADAAGGGCGRLRAAPAVTTPEAAAARHRRVHPDWPDNVALVARGGTGDAEPALPTADLIVEEAAPPSADHGHPDRDPRRPRLPGPRRPAGRLVVHAEPLPLRDAVSVVLGSPPGSRSGCSSPTSAVGFGPKGCVYPRSCSWRPSPSASAGPSSGSRAGGSTSPPRATTASSATDARIAFRRGRHDRGHRRRVPRRRGGVSGRGRPVSPSTPSTTSRGPTGCPTTGARHERRDAQDPERRLPGRGAPPRPCS